MSILKIQTKQGTVRVQKRKSGNLVYKIPQSFNGRIMTKFIADNKKQLADFKNS